MADMQVSGIVAPVRADVTDFLSKFDQVNEKTNIVSNNILNKLTLINSALRDVNSQSVGGKMFVSTNTASDVAVSQINKVISAQEKLAATSKNKIDLGQISNPDMLNRMAGAQNNFNNALNSGATGTNRLAEAQGKLAVNVLSSNKYLEMMRGHLTWMVTGGAIMAILGAPALAIHSIAEIEQQMAGMLQTLPSLYKDHVVNQEALNNVTHEFIGIAAQYGFEVDKVIEAGKLWSRGYKDVGDVMKLTGNSTKLAIADMMDVGLANRAVESTISGFKRQGDAVAFSNHVVDSWTNVAHNAQASAADLAESLIRSSSAANVVGVSFDFVTAQAATMIKNTGQSGAIIGNALKSIYASINTKKGREGLADLGIELYKLDTDGTKHLRNMESVLIDVMLATQGTSKNLQKDIEGIAGGKFQWGRAAALFGDYAEFIKNYNLSIQSAGVADKQVQAQLDTINRKVEQIKANMQGALMGPASAGLAQYIKDWLDSINMFVKGLQQVPTEVYSIIGTMTKYAVSIYAISKFIGLLSTGYAGLTAAMAANAAVTAANTVAQTGEAVAAGAGAVALEAEAVAANTAAAATGRLAAVTTLATGGMNLILAAIVAAGIGATVYSASVGEAVSAQEKERQATQDAIATKESQIAMNAKQVEFMGTLGNAYVLLQEKLKDASLTEAKKAELNKDVEATEKELAVIVGESTAKRILASDDIKGAIVEEQKVHAEKADNIKTAMDELVTAQRKLSGETIKECNDRIGAINAEATAFSLAADSIGQSLGRISQAMFELHRAKATSLEAQAEIIDKQNAEKENMPGWMKFGMALNNSDLDDAGSSTNSAELKRQAENENAAADAIKNRAISVNVETANTEQGKLYKPGTGGTSRIGGDETTDPADKKKKKKTPGTGSNIDPTKNFENIEMRNADQEKKNELLLQAKISADNYSTALDDITVKEALFGVTTATTAERAKIKTDRVAELLNEQKAYSGQMDVLHAQADKEREDQAKIEEQLDLNGMAFKDLSKVQKQEVREASKEWKMHEATIKELGKEWDSLAEHASNAGKKSKQIANENKIEIMVKNPQAEYSKAVQNNNYDKENAVLSLGRDYRKEQADAIELTTAIKNLDLAKAELLRIENLRGRDNEEYKKQLVAVNQLTNQIDTLKDKTFVVRSNMATMFDGMMRGTTSFQDFWKNAWMDMCSEAIRNIWQVNQAGSQTSFLGGLFGGLFGGSGGAKSTGAPFKSSNADRNLIGLDFRESGGPVKAGQPYIVGEKRPELFVPSTNGTIIPDLSMVRSGGNTVSNSPASGGDTIIKVEINPVFQSIDPAAGQAMFKSQMPQMLSEVENAIRNKSSMRSAVKGAAR